MQPDGVRVVRGELDEETITLLDASCLDHGFRQRQLALGSKARLRMYGGAHVVQRIGWSYQPSTSRNVRHQSD